MTEITMTTAVAEALEALLHLRDEHGAITPADVADAVEAEGGLAGAGAFLSGRAAGAIRAATTAR